MAKQVVIIQGGDFEAHYNRILQNLDNKYHSHPSNLRDIPLSEADRATLASYEAHARQAAGDGQTPVGKQVV